MTRKLLILLACIGLLLCCTAVAAAEETELAEDISSETQFSGTAYNGYRFLVDKDTRTFYWSAKAASITLENPAGMGSVYILFDVEYGEYTLTDNATGNSVTCGSYGFAHEFIDLVAAFGYAPASVTLDFPNGSVILGEIYVFTPGRVPEFVQRWEPPLEGGVDILMLPAHGDDDQLYFAGLLPYYAGELDLRVQVVYLTSHRCYTNLRVHEMLNGLWATGVEAYPVFAYRLDFREDSLQGSYQVYANLGTSRDQMVGFMVEQLRRFKPLVAVGHDIYGEYGHGMHRVYADMLMAAVEVSNDPQAYPESAQTYGVWDVPKTYLHLLEENPIVVDYDVPLEQYDGLTAFQVTQKYGFPCHITQQMYVNFGIWLYGPNGEITKASQIEDYSPCEFGLYRSTVGADVRKNDFMENVTSYDEQARLEQERLEQERLEQERLEKERLERERLEQERLEQERLEQERLEKERLEREEQERLALEEEKLAQLEAELRQAQNRYYLTITGIAVLFVVGFSLARHAGKKWAEKKNNRLGGEKKLKKK